jgi:signal transduction histidine kinase
MSLARIERLREYVRRRGDLAAAIALGVPVIATLLFRAVHDDQPLALGLAVAALAPLFLRRRRPIESLLLATAAIAVLPDNQALLLPVLAVLYTIASQRPWPTAAAAGVSAAIVVIVARAGWGAVTFNRGGLLGYAIGTLASCAAAVALGLYVGARRRVEDALRERAERLDRERELLADRAVATERLRIAQELHDVVAHNVSLMVVQAQALGATVDEPRVTDTTTAIADLGREAMAEMHRTLRLLRRVDDTEAAERAPQPSLANLERLVEQSRAAGLEIELIMEGQPRPLSQGVDLSAFRIIQEALTNVRKHADGAMTVVTLAYRAQGLLLTVSDSGDGSSHDHPLEHPEGHGVMGMRERATLFGGTLTAEPRGGRGFEVTAVLPYAAPGP